MSALYIDERTAASLINMDDALKLVEESFSSFSKGEAFNMTRQRMRIRKGALHMLPGAVPYKGVIGFKAYTSFRAGLIFKVHLYDAETGSPLAIIDANEIGRLRTGAASGIASKYMSKGSTIINVSSTNGTKTISPECLDYNISKVGLQSLTRDLAFQFKPNIRVNAVAIGWADTDMNTDLPEDYIKEETEKIYLERFATPSEIAKTIYFLASEESSYINGEIITIDGGYS